MKPPFGTPRKPWSPVVDGEIAKVPLTHGAWAIVDRADLCVVAPYAWHLNAQGYALTFIDRRAVFMHRLIIGGDPPATDHIDRDRLNNRRANLRPCTRAQNNRNRRSSRGKVPFKGAAFHRASGRYHATIAKDGRQRSLGYFDTPEEAAAAYDRAAVELFGEFALTNKELGLL